MVVDQEKRLEGRNGVRALGRRTGMGTAAALAASLSLGLLAQTGSLAAPTEAELDAARARLMELEADFQTVAERYNLVHEDLTGIQMRIGETELEVRRIERRMGVREDAAIQVARELYKGGSTGALEAVLSAQDFGEIESRLEYLRTTQTAQSEVFQALAADRSTLEAKLGQLEEDRAAALDAEQRLTALREEIETKLVEQEDEIAELNAAIEAAERRAERRAAATEAAAARTSLPVVPAAPAPAPNAGAQAAVDAALSQLGKPYQWAAAGPSSYDCSGLTMWAWAQAGVSLPHNSGMQYAATPRVAESDWQPGDLLFFGSPIHHVGMYIGNGQMVEAPYTGSQVRINSAYRDDYVGAGRPGS